MDQWSIRICWVRVSVGCGFGEGRLSSIHRLKAGSVGILYTDWQASCWHGARQAWNCHGVAASGDERVGKVDYRVLVHGYMHICSAIKTDSRLNSLDYIRPWVLFNAGKIYHSTTKWWSWCHVKLVIEGYGTSKLVLLKLLSATLSTLLPRYIFLVMYGAAVIWNGLEWYVWTWATTQGTPGSHPRRYRLHFWEWGVIRK